MDKMHIASPLPPLIALIHLFIEKYSNYLTVNHQMLLELLIILCKVKVSTCAGSTICAIVLLLFVNEHAEMKATYCQDINHC